MSTAVQVRSAVVLHGVASCSPAPQLVQMVQTLLLASEKLTLSTHSVGSLLPAAQLLPAGHAKHSACDVRLACVPMLPASQGIGSTLPSAQWWPSGHGKHATSPLVLTKLPAGHGVHSAMPRSGAMLPGRHRRHAVAFVCRASGL